ncbi:MAG: hypothetical protein K2K29_03885, partial [Muribaculaceae bacterium]|nr:hypothetical protein [Muribaculaceae bacterium]
MNHNKKLESTLKSQAGSEAPVDSAWAETYAEGIALIENALVVLSDLSRNRSYIYRGRFAKNFNLSEKSVENTIWEEEILHLIPADDREKKYLYELKYFQFLQQIPTSQLRDYYLVNTLRMQTLSGKLINVLHRTYYLYADDDRAIAFGLCIYQQ